MVDRLLLLNLLCLMVGCGAFTKMASPFEKIYAKIELEIARTFLVHKYEMSWERDPDIYLGDTENVDDVCGSGAAGCIAYGHILISRYADKCSTVLHELGHWAEGVGHYDYSHSGTLAHWYEYELFRLCEAIGDL